jgi:hypothetical protein
MTYSFVRERRPLAFSASFDGAVVSHPIPNVKCERTETSQEKDALCLLTAANLFARLADFLKQKNIVCF